MKFKDANYMVAVHMFPDGSGTFTILPRGRSEPLAREEVADAICAGAHDGDEDVWPHLSPQAKRTYFRMANEVAKLMGWEWPT